MDAEPLSPSVALFIEKCRKGVECECGGSMLLIHIERDHLVLFEEKTGNIRPLWKVKVRCSRSRCRRQVTARMEITDDQGKALKAMIAERKVVRSSTARTPAPPLA